MRTSQVRKTRTNSFYTYTKPEFPEERRGRELNQEGGPQSDQNNQNQASQSVEENRPLDLENGSQEWADNSQNDDIVRKT